MFSMEETRPKSLILSYISVFAALNAIADLIPSTPIVGIPGASFRLGWISSTLTGILLGPKMGGVSCLIGGLVVLLLGQGQAQFFGPLAPLRPAISAFTAGMLMSKNWRVPAILIPSLVSLWLLIPAGRDAAAILIFHITGLAIVLFLKENIGELAGSDSRRRSICGLLAVSYCGNVSRHLFGNILLATVYNLQHFYFVAAIPVTFIEQLFFAIGTAMIGAALNRSRAIKFLYR